MAPIRVGIIGLSKTGWASYAHLPYLLSQSGREKYQIVAVCNSSAKSAREAIELHQLPKSTRAYDDAEELAKDNGVDLVVCAVRVDRHFPTISPSLEAGKDAFVEWPLGKSLAEAEILLHLSKARGVKRTAVGLQGRFAPVIWKLKELVKDGRIGKVLSSTWTGYASNGGPTESEHFRYLADKEVGGNLVTIHFGHVMDYVQQVLGTFRGADSIIANRRPIIQLLNRDGSIAVKDYHKTADDTIMVHGIVQNGTPVSINLRGGRAFKDTPGMDWRIYGETGEIRITATGAFIHIGYPDIVVSVHDFESDEVEMVEVGHDRFEDLPLPARNVAKVYEAFANGDERILCDFQDAVVRHRLIEILYKQNGG